jgi:phosphoadenosine phosphosulfate reductase
MSVDPPALVPLIDAIEAKFIAYKHQNLRLFSTSSFQSNSVLLLHLLSRFAREVPVYFLNTGFHFPETLIFRRELAQSLGLRIIDLRSPISRLQQRDPTGHLLYASDPDHCCHLNKVLPLDPILASHDVWVNGVRASQSSTRSAMQEEERGRNGILRYHPILRWHSRQVYQYLQAHALPGHPLEEAGYLSVGCSPCTRKPDFEGDLDDRSGRWSGMNKTECGLHLAETK